MLARTRFVVRPCGSEDQPRLLELARRSFDDPPDEATWRARFLGNPMRRADVMAAFAPDGRCLAMFPSVPLPFRYGSDEGLAQGASFVAIDPELRGGLARGRLLVSLIDGFSGLLGGGAVRITFGSPEPALTRVLTTRPKSSQILWDVAFLVRELEPRCEAPADLRVEARSGPPPDVDELWATFGQTLQVAVIRDARYLDWRYRPRPGVRYSFRCLRDGGGRLRALAVLRPGGWDPRALSVMEWMVDPDDHDAQCALLRDAQDVAARAGLRFLVTWFSPTARETYVFQSELGFFVRPSPHQVIFRSYHVSVRRETLYDRWYQSMGDLEFL